MRKWNSWSGNTCAICFAGIVFAADAFVTFYICLWKRHIDVSCAMLIHGHKDTCLLKTNTLERRKLIIINEGWLIVTLQKAYVAAQKKQQKQWTKSEQQKYIKANKLCLVFQRRINDLK